MKPSPRSVIHFAPARPAARTITRLARVTLVLALIFAATLPSSAGDRRRGQRVVGNVYGWGNYLPDAPDRLSGVSGAVAVASGGHSLILKPDGTVQASGWNDYGQLGDGTTGGVARTVQVVGLTDVVAVAAGLSHSIAVKSDGTVWTWGRNDYGQLGIEGGDRPTPVQAPGLSGVVAVAAGYQHSLAIRDDGTVWAWGRNDSSQLGVSGPSSSTPAQVGTLSAVVAVAGGVFHSLALKSDGTVWAWGANGQGQLGRGAIGDPPATPTPVQVVDGFGGYLSGVKKIATTSSHNLAVKADGTVWAWGANSYGQLGNGVLGTGTDSGAPVQAAGLTGVVDVAAGDGHSVALEADGTVWTWGHNGYGQLGTGARDAPHPTPTRVGGFSGVVTISAGGLSTLALQSQAGGMAWGNNAFGQLGNGTNTIGRTPVQVNTLSGLAAISGGNESNLALQTDGSAWAWGQNDEGQLGDGTNTNRNAPVRVSGLSSGVVAVAAAEDNGFALSADGTVRAWGNNAVGTLGNGIAGNSNVPVGVVDSWFSSALSDVVAIASGGFHGMALKSDGTVWAWGTNGFGQLGQGSTPLASSIAVQVRGLDGGGHLSDVVAIAKGRGHSLALKSDGTVWAWGHNIYGQLGDGTTTTRTTPVPVVSLSNVVAIACGIWHSLALKSDGTVWAWGWNALGQLGDGTTTTSYTPVQVSGLSLGAAIAGGQAYSIALKSDGTVWTWGSNANGELGTGTGTDSRTPVQVSGLSSPSDIYGGGYHAGTLASGAAATLTLGNLTQTYDGTPRAISVTTSPLGVGVTVTYTGIGDTAYLPSAVPPSNAGDYSVTAVATGNYTGTTSATLTVNPAPLSITAKDGIKPEGMTLVWVQDEYYPGSYITVNGLRNADTVTGIYLTTDGASGTAAAAPTSSPRAGRGERVGQLLHHLRGRDTDRDWSFERHSGQPGDDVRRCRAGAHLHSHRPRRWPDPGHRRNLRRAGHGGAAGRHAHDQLLRCGEGRLRNLVR